MRLYLCLKNQLGLDVTNHICELIRRLLEQSIRSMFHQQTLNTYQYPPPCVVLPDNAIRAMNCLTQVRLSFIMGGKGLILYNIDLNYQDIILQIVRLVSDLNLKYDRIENQRSETQPYLKIYSKF
jgi:hypothetical protein